MAQANPNPNAPLYVPPHHRAVNPMYPAPFREEERTQYDINDDIISKEPCENVVFYNKYLTTSPIISGMIFRNLNLRPFTSDWELIEITTMVYIGTVGRARFLNVDAMDTDLIYTVVMAERLGPFLSRNLFLAENEARITLVNSVKLLLNSQDIINRIVTGFDDNIWGGVVNDQNHIINSHQIKLILGTPIIEDIGENMTPEGAVRILFYLANSGNKIFQMHPLRK